MPFKVVDTSVPNVKVEIERFATRKEVVTFAPVPLGNGWISVALDLKVDAVQTFSGLCDLQVIWGYGKIIQRAGQAPQYQIDAPGPPLKLQWNGWTATHRLEDYKQLDIPPSMEGLPDRFIIATLVYTVDRPSFAMDSATCNVRFGALVWNADETAPLPGFGDIGQDDNPNWKIELDVVQLALLGIGVAGLAIAVGYLISSLTGAGRQFGVGGSERRLARG